MKVIIELDDKLEKERVLEYFYQACLYDPIINKFKVSIEGSDLMREKR